MSIINRIPTANETPDTANGIGGDIAVTTPSNEGHASTSVVSSGVGLLVKSCRWFTFQNLFGGLKIAIKLKVTHTSNGSSSDGFIDTGNRFQLQYSLNGGGAWSDIVDRVNMSSSQGPTVAEVSLSLTQDLTQIQVRDIISADGLFGQTATASATISDIKIEVTVPDPSLLD